MNPQLEAILQAIFDAQKTHLDRSLDKIFGPMCDRCNERVGIPCHCSAPRRWWLMARFRLWGIRP